MIHDLREVETVVLVRVIEELGGRFEVRDGKAWCRDETGTVERLDLWTPLQARGEEVHDILEARQVVDTLIEELSGKPQLGLRLETPTHTRRR